MSRNLFGGAIRSFNISGLGSPYQNRRSGISKKILRRIVWKRDRGTCRLCGIKIRTGEDWDLARNRAGKNKGKYTEKNCFVAHHSCNISQGTKTRGQIRKELGQKSNRTLKRKTKRKLRASLYINPLSGKKEKFNFLKF